MNIKIGEKSNLQESWRLSRRHFEGLLLISLIEIRILNETSETRYEPWGKSLRSLKTDFVPTHANKYDEVLGLGMA
jgi:hypothetical protein